MNFDPETWLVVADICCSNIPGVNREALLRTALNRAYYAALLTLKHRIDAAQGQGTVPTWRSHEAIKQAVLMGGESFEEISKRLTELRVARETADYVVAAQDLERITVLRKVERARWIIRNHIKVLPDDEFRRLCVPRG